MVQQGRRQMDEPARSVQAFHQVEHQVRSIVAQTNHGIPKIHGKGDAQGLVSKILERPRDGLHLNQNVFLIPGGKLSEFVIQDGNSHGEYGSGRFQGVVAWVPGASFFHPGKAGTKGTTQGRLDDTFDQLMK